MTCESTACSECAKNCMLIHKKMKNAAPTSFFKVMFGSGFSERLFLPPKFAPTVSSLIDQKIHLEDIKGRHWDVCISNCEGSFAIEEGWSNFSLDHGLELGDFLLFHYLGSYFVIKIYDKTGCEKSDFPWSLKDNKQSCTARNSFTQEDLCYTRSNDGSSNNPCSSSSIVSRTNVAAIQSEKEANHPESVANNPRESTSDVEILENHCKESKVVPKKDLEMKSVDQKVSYGINNKNFANHLENPKAGLGLKKHKYQELHEDVKKNLKGEAIQSVDKGVTSTSRNPYLGKETIREAIRSADKGVTNTSRNPYLGKETIKEAIWTADKGVTSTSQNPYHGKQELKGAIRSADKGVTSTSQNPYHGKEKINDRSKVQLKKEPVELSHGLSSLIKMTLEGKGSTMKEGHLRSYDKTSSGYRLKGATVEDVVGSSSGRADTVKAMISSLSRLELPVGLPASLPSANSVGRGCRERKLVFLEDPLKRIWPVLYEETPECGVLANGWEGFVKAHELQMGDECIFQHIKDSTYRVSISQRQQEKLALSFLIQ